MRFLILAALTTILLVVAIQKVRSDEQAQPPQIPPIHFPQYQCHYEVDGKGQFVKVCGWY